MYPLFNFGLFCFGFGLCKEKKSVKTCKIVLVVVLVVGSAVVCCAVWSRYLFFLWYQVVRNLRGGRRGGEEKEGEKVLRLMREFSLPFKDFCFLVFLLRPFVWLPALTSSHTPTLSFFLSSTLCLYG